MAEQKEKLKSVRDNLETLLTAPRSDIYDPDEIIENCVSILDEVLGNQQSFKIGEYYKRPNNDICKITSIENEVAYITFLNAERGNLLDTQFNIVRDGKLYTKATAEEIALFKRAEHFHSKGRKLNEFRQGDIVKERNENGLVIEVRKHGQIIVQYPNELLQVAYYKFVHESLDLIMTAEEQEATEVKG